MDDHDRLLGEIAVQLGPLTREQLSKSLHAQKNEPRPRDLGEVMVALELLTRDQLMLCMGMNAPFEAPSPASHPKRYSANPGSP